MPENDKLKFSQLAEITRAQMAGSDYAVGYKANGDNKKWTFENQADFLLNDSDAGQEFQETFVKVQDTEPSDENNKIWVKETPEEEVEVPTYDEFESVEEDVANLKSDISYLNVGKANLFSLATPYKGYFSDSGVSSNYTQGLQTNADWGFFVFPVKKGNRITVSGLTTVSGARNVWLNSSDPADFNSVASKTHETDKTYTCQTDWMAITMFNPTAYINSSSAVVDNVSVNNLKVCPTLIQADNYSTFLPDANNITESIVYKLNYGGNDSRLPLNLPFSQTPYGEIFVLVTYANAGSGSNAAAQQYLYGSGTDVWYRSKGSSWNKWSKAQNGYTYTVGASGCDYTAIVPAVMQAVKRPNSRVYIKDGTYDLINEFQTYVSSTFFSNYSTSQSYGTGLHLYNGVIIEMSSNAKITCHYTGEDTNVRSNFAPFVGSYGDFTMINVTVEASNVRYCVHDDNITKNVMPSHHKYKGCAFTLDNTGLQGNPDTMAVIGGGLDYSSYIEVEDCYLKSLGSVTRDIVNTPSLACAGYHNTNVSNARSHIIFKNCYCEYGTITFGKYGDTTKMTDIEVTGCSMKYQPYTYWEAQSQYEVDNMTLRQWGNEVRSN